MVRSGRFTEVAIGIILSCCGIEVRIETAKLRNTITVIWTGLKFGQERWSVQCCEQSVWCLPSCVFYYFLNLLNWVHAVSTSLVLEDWEMAVIQEEICWRAFCRWVKAKFHYAVQVADRSQIWWHTWFPTCCRQVRAISTYRLCPRRAQTTRTRRSTTWVA